MKKDEIKKLLDRKNWSVVCDRAKSAIDEFEKRRPIENIEVVQTSDYNFATRKHVAYENGYEEHHIGQGHYKGSYLFLRIK